MEFDNATKEEIAKYSKLVNEAKLDELNLTELRRLQSFREKPASRFWRENRTQELPAVRCFLSENLKQGSQIKTAFPRSCYFDHTRRLARRCHEDASVTLL